MLEQLKQTFIETFGSINEVQIFFAPGRVNLIGEHTDYNGGHVFPCALSIGTYAIARKRNDRKIRLYSMNYAEASVIEVDLNDLSFDDAHGWANYPIGVVWTFLQSNYSITTGFEVAFYGNIPNGAGLSSSASIELATSIVLKELFEFDIEKLDMIKLSQKAENEFVGVTCGIMDQFAIGMGKKDHAILLNCDTLEYVYSPILLEEYAMIIADTNKRRGLTDSKYNERRKQCEEALKTLKRELDIETLADLTKDDFEKHRLLIEDPIIQKRAKHVVYENRRTIEAVEKLNRNDINGFGRLMNESHRSLRDDYEVSCKELDVLVKAAWNEDVIGSRMTGAGFGGCTINIVARGRVDSFIERVGSAYRELTGLDADFYVVEIGDGVTTL
ncbi:galactokinase [Pseudalkalibacillus decolorationis]|uniref:galactokinase n=1 Tax=Pseudalkalibacillus decolorationis TaxID=163879 RepID=UPI002148FD41|nr:galactokinase [Pseudalkalibacillus decolorationis]